MPRPAARPLITPPSPSAQTLPDDLLVLRRQWKWAAFTQFLVTFAPVFSMEDVTVNDIENDLVHSTSVVIPRIMQRLLYCLTYDRKISLDTWQAALLKQYFKRDPSGNPLGGELGRYSKSIEPSTVPPTPKDEHVEDAIGEGSAPAVNDVPNGDEPATPAPSTKLSRASESRQTLDDPATRVKDWLQLSMLQKLDSMHLLTEWQFHNPTRLRQIMKSDDENATWRVEPIGFDAKKNAYWLIGEDRLWIQRHPPRSDLKRKRPLGKANGKSAKSKRSRIETTTRSKLAPSPTSQPKDTPSGRGVGRAAKLQAKQKLDAQAKELAELNRQAAATTSSSTSTRRTRGHTQTSSPSPTKLPGRPVSNSRPLGTRLSLRLRGSLADEWQSVPDDWLLEPESHAKPQKHRTAKTGLESDDDTISDLTELSEDMSPKVEFEDETPEESQKVEPLEPRIEIEPADGMAKDEPTLPVDFVEWETIAVTLEEWQHVAEPFAKATHYAEKALCKVLNAVAPIVIEQLQEIERKRRIEDAVTHRKRSSRLALREIEKEEARMAAKKRADDEEKLGRARRAEARQQKEEAERQRRENAREQRRIEREAKEEAQRKVRESSTATSKAGSSSEQLQPCAKVNGSGSGSRTPNTDWELDCEICLRHGLNLDDGMPMMSCGSCSKWQHISCHDRADHAAGRPKRNWDVVEFLCHKCKAAKSPNGYIHGRPGASYPVASVTSAPIQLTAPYHTNNSFKVSTGVAPYQHYPAQHASSSYTQGAYATQPPITFSHYQPQQRVFMTSQVHQPYGSPATHQPYGVRQNGHVSPQPLNHAVQGWNPATQAQSYYNPSSERSSATPTWRGPQPQGQHIPTSNSWYPPIPQVQPLPTAVHPPPHNPVSPQSQFYPP